MTECSSCLRRVPCEDTVAMGELPVCERCFSNDAVRRVLGCEARDETVPACWLCSAELDHHDPGIQVGGWSVCTRCYATYEAARARYREAVEDPHDYLWLMNQDCELLRYEAERREEDDAWLSRQVASLELERGVP